MPRKKHNKLNEVRKHAIYVLLSPFDNNVYLGHCGVAYLKNTYSKLFNLHHRPTADLFQQAKEAGLQVHMFLLQEVECSTRELFRYTICWATLLTKSGYILGFSSSLIPYVDDFKKETAIIYESIKNQPLDALLHPSRSLFPNYKQNYHATSASIPSKINFCVTADEYKRIKEMSVAENLTISRFCQLKALRNKTVNINTDAIELISEEYTSIKRILGQILYTIYISQQYAPRDLEMIQNSMDRITQLHGTLSDRFTELLREVRRS